MFDNLYETEEQRRRRLEQGAAQNQSQTPLTSRQLIEQAWDRSAAEQAAKEKELEPMKNMSTREALEYAWDRAEQKSRQQTSYNPNQIQTPYNPENKDNIQTGIQTPYNPDHIQTPYDSEQKQTLYKPNEYVGRFYFEGDDKNPDYWEYLNRNRKQLCGPGYEEYHNYAYLDTAKNPKATIGCGINISDTPDVQLQNRHTGVDFIKKEQEAQLKKLYNSYKENHLAKYYKDKSDIGISRTEHERVLRNKYADAYENVTKNYPDFRNLTTRQQNALLDMNYNMGTPVFNKYTKLKDAVNEKRWEDAAYESYRPGVGLERNKWAAQAFDPELRRPGWNK